MRSAIYWAHIGTTAWVIQAKGGHVLILLAVSAGGWVHVRGNLLERLVGGVLGSS